VHQSTRSRRLLSKKNSLPKQQRKIGVKRTLTKHFSLQFMTYFTKRKNQPGSSPCIYPIFDRVSVYTPILRFGLSVDGASGAVRRRYWGNLRNCRLEVASKNLAGVDLADAGPLLRAAGGRGPWRVRPNHLTLGSYRAFRAATGKTASGYAAAGPRSGRRA
jgi:hypothetical protein